ncbi:hypothetical protein ACFLVX_04855 [Chloroflexota bacterium]
MEYLYIGITALFIIVLFLLFLREKGKQLRKPSNLATIGMTLVVLGIIFIGAGRLISYSFFGVAVLLSIIDIIRIHKSKERPI